MKAKLVFLTGMMKGTEFDIQRETVRIGRLPELDVVFPPAEETHVSRVHASIRFEDGRYVIRDDGSTNGTFVNHDRITERVLNDGDVIDFGLGGPAACFVASDEDPETVLAEPAETKAATPESVPAGPGAEPDGPVRQRRKQKPKQGTVTTLFQDLVLNRPPGRGTTEALRDFVKAAYEGNKRRTRIMVGGTVAVGIFAIGVSVWWGEQQQERIRQEARTQIARVEQEARSAVGQLAAALATERRSREEAEARLDSLSSAYTLLQREQERQITAFRNQLGFTENVARSYRAGVSMVTSTIAYIERGGNRPVRAQTDPSGRKVLHLRGEGPIYTEASGGTAFLIHEDGWLLTNCHVIDMRCVPRGLTNADRISALVGRRVDPVFINERFKVFFPPGDESFSIEIAAVSNRADVALVRVRGGTPTASPLPLAPPDVNLGVGQDVALVGYPAGSSLLCYRAREEAHRELGCGSPRVNVEALARRGLIQPLVSSGKISDLGESSVVYSVTGASTGGSSGSPLIGPDRRVIGVHFAGRPAGVRTLRAAPIRYAWALFPPSLRESLASRSDAATAGELARR